MKLCESLSRILLRRNRSSLTSINAAFSLSNAKSSCVPRDSYLRIGASSHSDYDRVLISDKWHCLGWCRSQRCDCRPYFPSGFQSPHWIATANYRRLQDSEGNPFNVKDFKCLPVRRLSCQFISGGPALWGLVAANSAVFGMWQTMSPQIMNMHFVFSAANVASGRWHTLITAAFSHASVEHLLWNLLGLLSFGMLVEEMYGGLNMLLMYAGASMCGSFGHIKYVTLIQPWLKGIPVSSFSMGNTPGCLGASGVVIAFVILIILHHPTHTVDFLVYSMPAAAVGCLIVGKDLYFALKGGATVSLGAHLGGAAYGLLMYSITQLHGSILGP